MIGVLLLAVAAPVPAAPALDVRFVPERSVVRGTVRIDVRGAKDPTALRFAASAGTLSGSGATRTLVLPDSNAPRTIAVAVTDGAAHGAAYLPVVGRTALPVETQPGAAITVSVAGRLFGPTVAKRRKVDVEIEVPPGVRTATVTARDKLGNERNEVVDLGIPDLSSIAVSVADARVAAGSSVRFPVAFGEAGGPSREPPVVVGPGGAIVLERVSGAWIGTMPPVSALGPVRLDARGGQHTASVDLQIVPGKPHRVVFDPPVVPMRPDVELRTRIVVVDAFEHVVSGPVTLTASGIEASLDGPELTIRTGTSVPSTRQARLVFDVAGARLEEVVKLRAGPPTSATIATEEDGRLARLRVVVTDEAGNRVLERDEVKIESTGTSTMTLELERDGFDGVVVADAVARRATVEILSGERVIGSSPVRFEPPSSAYLLAAYVALGYNQDLLAPASARVGLGVGLRKGLGPIEVGLFGGGEFLRYSQDESRNVGGVVGTLASSTTVLAFPLQLRGRIPFGRWFGAGAAGAVAPTLAVSTVQFENRAPAESRTWLVGLRGLLFVDFKIGPGRLALGGGYGRAKLARRDLSGELEGAFGRVWYEFHFVDLGG